MWVSTAWSGGVVIENGHVCGVCGDNSVIFLIWLVGYMRLIQGNAAGRVESCTEQGASAVGLDL